MVNERRLNLSTGSSYSEGSPFFDGTDTFFEWPQNLMTVKKSLSLQYSLQTRRGIDFSEITADQAVRAIVRHFRLLG